MMYAYLARRIDRSAEMSGVLSKLGHHPGSSIHLSKDTLEGGVSSVAAKTEGKEEKQKEELSPVVKYVKNQVR